MSTQALPIGPTRPARFGALAVLAAGRASLMLCSIASIRLSTSQLGPAEMGAMNLVLNTVNLFALLVAAFSLYFYRQVLEWQHEGRLLRNLKHYAGFLLCAAALASLVTLLLQRMDSNPWQGLPAAGLVALVAGNLFVATMNAAVLYCLNALEQRASYVLLSNLASWGGLLLAVFAATVLHADALLWLAGLLGGQALSLMMAGLRLLRVLGRRPDTGVASVTMMQAADFDLRSAFAFAWPLVLCGGLYWVQRSSFAPWMAATAGHQTLGLFSVAFSVGLLSMAAFDTLFTEYYMPIFYRSIVGGDVARRAPAWDRYASALLPALAVTFVLVAACADALLHLLVHPDFHGLAGIVALGAASQWLISAYSLHVLLSSSFMDNRALLLPNLLGAMVAVLVLLLLSSWNAMLGAALAVNAGLLATTALAALRMRRNYGTRWPVRRTLRALAVALPLLAIGPVVDGIAHDASALARSLITVAVAAIGTALIQHRLARAWL